jgi:hypothetical protein
VVVLEQMLQTLLLKLAGLAEVGLTAEVQVRQHTGQGLQELQDKEMMAEAVTILVQAIIQAVVEVEQAV